MQGAGFALVVNIAVAALFAASFAFLAIANPGRRSAFGFAASYAVGMLTPLSEFLLPMSPWPWVLVVMSYASFVAGLLLMTGALAMFFGRAPPWRGLATLFVASLLVRFAIWGGARNTMPYELIYQLPFAVASGLSAGTVLAMAQRRWLEIVLAAMFALVSAHFVVKPFLAVTYGSGATAEAYKASLYALLSQAVTGILLIATGLLVLLLVAQAAIADARAEADTDVLSALPNRRGFDRDALALLDEAGHRNHALSALLIDIDHFKRINDTFGHATGDVVIQGVASILRRMMPAGSCLGRIGGEEYAALMPVAVDQAATQADALRIAIATTRFDGAPPVTVSVGLTPAGQGERLSDIMRRADAALYAAKAGGRDQVRLTLPKVAAL